jgi:hypothetical protein
MLVANPAVNITEIGAGAAAYDAVGRGDAGGNAAVWVRAGARVESKSVLVTMVRDYMIDAGNCGLTVTRTDAARVAAVDRSLLHLLRNGDAEYGSLEEAADTERTAMSADHTLGYDASTGFIFLSEGNQRANFDRIGWSQVMVRGHYTVEYPQFQTEDLAFSIVGSDRPEREDGRGLFVCADEDDRALVSVLMEIVRQSGTVHPLDMRAGLGAIWSIAEQGASAPVLPSSA